jgi:hypothetical protein
MKKLTKGLAFASVALLAAGQIYAQSGGKKPDDDKKDKPAQAAKPASVLSAEEMNQLAQSMRGQVRKDIQRVQYLQEIARKEKDVIKLGCVNDKFIALKAEANIFDAAHTELIGRLGGDDRVSAYEATSKAAIAVHKAREEADACIGNKEMSTDSSDFRAPVLLDDPTTGMPFDIPVEPPGFASPFI